MIYVSITKAELLKHEACDEGMRLFDAIASGDEWVGKWTPLHSVWLATAYPAFRAWLRHRGLIPITDLAHANLFGADLSGANLSRAYLSGADLSRANLSGANADALAVS